MRKSVFLLVVVLVGMIAITGCKKGEKDEETTPEEVAVKTPPLPKNTAPTKAAVTETAATTPELNNDALTIPAPTPDFSGSYQGARAMLDVQKMSPQLSRFSLQMHPSGECTGELNGIVSMLTDDHGEYVEKDCTLAFDFGKQWVQVKEEGDSCHDHHSEGCSFSDDYRVGGAIKEKKHEQEQQPKTSLAGHYIHKNISIDGTRCKGWEIWLTGPKLALAAEVAIYDEACNSERLSAENIKYNATLSTLDFDVLRNDQPSHFSGTFDHGTDLYGQFTY